MQRRILRLNSFTTSILILQITVFLVVYFNIPIARVIIGFAYLLFVPGILIQKLLGLKTADISESILFSIGLSIAFLMFIGLAINEIGKLITTQPLSLNLIIFNVNAVLLLFILISNVHNHSSSLNIERTKYTLPILLSILILLLGSYGIFLVNHSGNNFSIFLLVLAISIKVSFIFAKEKNLTSHPLLLLNIFICCLLFLSTAGYVLVTPYLLGLGDQWTEYYCFKLTRWLWDPTFSFPNIAATSTYSMISVTILPTIFLNITGMDSSMLFKLLFPIVTSFTVIGAYRLYLMQTTEKTAFLAAFYLITIGAFKGMGPSKQLIAQLFYVLIFLLLLKKDVQHSKKVILLTIFTFALIMSHYSLSYIALIVIAGFVSIITLSEYLKAGKIHIDKWLISFTLLFLIIAFSWYIFCNQSAVWKNLCESIGMVINDLDEFFNPTSRGTALQGLGLVETPTFYHRISSIVFILTEIFLIFGFIELLRNRKKSSFSFEYKIFATINMGIIAVNLLLPRIADTFLMERFYQTALIIVAPLAVIGGKALLRVIFRRRFEKAYTAILLFSVFIPLFIFQTGFVYELTKSPNWSISLSKHRTTQLELYRKFGCINDYYVFGAEWLSNNIPSIFTPVYADKYARNTELRGYALIYLGYVKLLSNVTTLENGDFVYLNPSNTVYGTIVGERYEWNVSDLQYLHNLSHVYSNGGSEIYKSTP
ncbi:MAG: DUF2206 domain-containing protein [Nitrososphaeria archaeon]